MIVAVLVGLVSCGLSCFGFGSRLEGFVVFFWPILVLSCGLSRLTPRIFTSLPNWSTENHATLLSPPARPLAGLAIAISIGQSAHTS